MKNALLVLFILGIFAACGQKKEAAVDETAVEEAVEEVVETVDSTVSAIADTVATE